MKLLTYLHDPDDLYIPLLTNLVIPEELKDSIIAISPTTTDKVRKLVNTLSLKEIEGGTYGTARINLLNEHIKSKEAGDAFVCDFDKVIHWLNTNKSEFLQTFKQHYTVDLTIVGRSVKATATYPHSWIDTESIATRILAKIIRQNLDFMNGPSILSNKAANIFAKNANETGVGSCVEFCLLAHTNNLSINTIEVDGLTWEDPDRYKEMIQQALTYEDWKYDVYDSLYEWRKRVEFLNKQVEVMIRYSEEPTNPKYPLVHNKTIESTK